MAGTTNIPLTTLAPGTYSFGPAALADTDSQAVLTVDRTPAGGLNSAPVTTTVQIIVQQSDDGGATWVQRVAYTLSGGSYAKGANPPVTTSGCVCNFQPATGREVRAQVVVAGASIAVAGSLVIS